MELHRTEQGFALYKEKDCIGECTLSPAPKGAQLAALCILPRWRRKGYGSYLLKEVLRSFGGYDREAATGFTAPLPENAAERAGALLFAAANAMRLAGVDAEEALTFASRRFCDACLQQEQRGIQADAPAPIEETK